jgi:CRISPR-associated protein Cpf1
LENKEPLPTSGDANGAFNIARKGLIMLMRIEEKPENPNLFVSDEEWDEFLDE